MIPGDLCCTRPDLRVHYSDYTVRMWLERTGVKIIRNLSINEVILVIATWDGRTSNFHYTPMLCVVTQTGELGWIIADEMMKIEQVAPHNVKCVL